MDFFEVLYTIDIAYFEHWKSTEKYSTVQKSQVFSCFFIFCQLKWYISAMIK